MGFPYKATTFDMVVTLTFPATNNSLLKRVGLKFEVMILSISNSTTLRSPNPSG